MEGDKNKELDIHLNREHQEEPGVSGPVYNESKARNLIIGVDGEEAALEYEVDEVEADDGASMPA